MSRPKVITLTPDALDRNGISTTETLLATRLDFLINGALSTGFDADGICAAQTTAGATALTLNGALGVDFHTRKGVYILIAAATADNTGVIFTVVGEDDRGNRISEAITGPDNGLTVLGSTKFWHVTSVTPDGAVDGNVTVGVNGYVEFSTPQHVAQYSAGDDTGDTYTARGYDRYGNEVTDSITGVNAGTSTTQDQNFAWVDRVSSSGASTGAVESGSDGVCESAWFVLNYRGPDFNVAIGCTTAGATYAMQHTFTNVLATGFAENDAVVLTHSTLTGETTNQDGNYTNSPVATRLAITTAGTTPVTATIIHAGRS
ncbi:MAG: hypothetical protein HOE83_17110 [Alphaproteobacteria bacterium]|jgi:hypothetical protein|nr:hypothetical protein [Alphaproteobacteria bacterium]